MLFDHDAADISKDFHPRRWFLAGGATGFLSAVLLAIGYDAVPTSVLLVLWPLAMVQLIDPRTIGAQVAVVLIAYGSNFVLYGLIGIVIGFTANRLLELLRRR